MLVDEYDQTPEDLSCLVCHLTCFNPMICAANCAAIICQRCYEKEPQFAQKYPQCNANKGYQDVNRFTMKLLNKIVVKCLKHGCPNQNALKTYEQLLEHNCTPIEISCPIKCVKMLTKAIQDSHWSECPKAILLCSKCSADIMRENKLAHNFDCPMVQVNCDKCDMKILRKNKLQHKNECANEFIQCEECLMKYLLKDSKQHDCMQAMKKFVITLQNQNNDFKEQLSNVKEENKNLRKEVAELKANKSVKVLDKICESNKSKIAAKMKENDWECESCNTRNQWVKDDVNSSRCRKCFVKNKMIEEMIIVMSDKKK